MWRPERAGTVAKPHHRGTHTMPLTQESVTFPLPPLQQHSTLGHTALHAAAAKGYEHIVDALLRMGSDPSVGVVDNVR